MGRFAIFSIFGLVLMTGCGTIATPAYEATVLIRDARGSATAIVREAQATERVAPTLTAVPTISHTATPTNAPTTAPTETAIPTTQPAPTISGDAANGEVLFNTFQPVASFACATCHLVDSENRLIGPGLLNIGVRAETRVAGLSATEYLLQSIVEPSAYVIDSFPDDLMPQTWAEIYNEQEINDIIAYLMTLQE